MRNSSPSGFNTQSVSGGNVWSRVRAFTPGPSKSSGADHIWCLSSNFLSFTVETLKCSFYFDGQLKRAGSDVDGQLFTWTLVVLIPRPESEYWILESIFWFCITYWLETGAAASWQLLVLCWKTDTWDQFCSRWIIRNHLYLNVHKDNCRVLYLSISLFDTCSYSLLCRVRLFSLVRDCVWEDAAAEPK